MSIVSEMKKGVAKKKTEHGEVTAASSILIRHGYFGTPEKETRKQDGMVIRLYTWYDTPEGDLTLVTGPGLEGELVVLNGPGVYETNPVGQPLSGRRPKDADTIEYIEYRPRLADGSRPRVRIPVPSGLVESCNTCHDGRMVLRGDQPSKEAKSRLRAKQRAQREEEKADRAAKRAAAAKKRADAAADRAADHAGIQDRADKRAAAAKKRAAPKKKAKVEVVFKAKTRGGKYTIKAERHIEPGRGDTYSIHRYTSGRQMATSAGIRSMRDLQIELAQIIGSAAFIDEINYKPESWGRTFDITEFEFLKDRHIEALSAKHSSVPLTTPKKKKEVWVKIKSDYWYRDADTGETLAGPVEDTRQSYGNKSLLRYDVDGERFETLREAKAYSISLSRAIPKEKEPGQTIGYLRAREVIEIPKLMEARLLAKSKGEAPFRAPHHTSNIEGIKDELDRAQGGMLYLDQLEEFPLRVIENLNESLRHYPYALIAWRRGPDTASDNRYLIKNLEALGVATAKKKAAPKKKKKTVASARRKAATAKPSAQENQEAIMAAIRAAIGGMDARL